MAFTKPTTVAPWATSGVNIIAPIPAYELSGWQVNERPPAQWQNYLQNAAHLWFRWLNERMFDVSGADNLLIKPAGDGYYTAGSVVGTDIAGKITYIDSGIGTGTGGASVLLRAATAGVSGSSLNTHETYVVIDGFLVRVALQKDTYLVKASPVFFIGSSSGPAIFRMSNSGTLLNAGGYFKADASNQFKLGSRIDGITDADVLRFETLNTQSVFFGSEFSGSGTNINAGDLFIRTAASTGTGAGIIAFSVSESGASGTAVNNPTNIVTLSGPNKRVEVNRKIFVDGDVRISRNSEGTRGGFLRSAPTAFEIGVNDIVGENYFPMISIDRLSSPTLARIFFGRFDAAPAATLESTATTVSFFSDSTLNPQIGRSDIRWKNVYTENVDASVNVTANTITATGVTSTNGVSSTADITTTTNLRAPTGYVYATHARIAGNVHAMQSETNFAGGMIYGDATSAGVATHDGTASRSFIRAPHSAINNISIFDERTPSGADQDGNNIIIAGGRTTGNQGSDIRIQAAKSGLSGITLNNPTDFIVASGTERKIYFNEPADRLSCNGGIAAPLQSFDRYERNKYNNVICCGTFYNATPNVDATTATSGGNSFGASLMTWRIFGGNLREKSIIVSLTGTINRNKRHTIYASGQSFDYTDGTNINATGGVTYTGNRFFLEETAPGSGLCAFIHIKFLAFNQDGVNVTGATLPSLVRFSMIGDPV